MSVRDPARSGCRPSGPRRAGRRGWSVRLAPAGPVSAALLLVGLLAGMATSCSDPPGDDGDGETAAALSPIADQPPEPPAARPTAGGAATATTTPAAPASSAGSAAEAPTTSPYATPSGDALIEALAQELVGAAPDGPRPLALTEARCVSAGLITRLGPEALARLGASAGAGGIQAGVASLAPAERQTFADAVLACFDVRQLLATRFGVADLSAGAVDCLVTVLVRDGTLADILREAVLQGTDPAVAAGRLTGSITDGLRRCLTPDELGRLRLAR
jgi:hypothetical protein